MARFYTDILLLVSKEDYDLCLGRRFKGRENTYYIGNGVDLQYKFNPDRINQTMRNQLRSQWGLDQRDIVFIFVGRLVKEERDL